MGKLQIHMMQAQAALFPFLEGCISLYKQKAEMVFHWESQACQAWVPSSHPFSFHLREREVPFIQESPFPEPSASWCFRALCYPASPCTQLLLIPSSLSSYPLHDRSSSFSGFFFPLCSQDCTIFPTASWCKAIAQPAGGCPPRESTTASWPAAIEWHFHWQLDWWLTLW